MRRPQIVIGLIVVILLFGIPFTPPLESLLEDSMHHGSEKPLLHQTNNHVADSESAGTLNPVTVEHLASTSSSWINTGIARTDVYSSPFSEAYLPSGDPGNQYSGDCSGGYFYVGVGGSGDFGSPAGTISCWIKWDGTAPHGRFWGQHANFETRWDSGRLVLDWGSDNTMFGSKNTWEVDHWYFIAIAWNQTSNSLSIYWGDETTNPTEDASTNSWVDSVVGLHTENNIMNSISRSDQQVDGRVDDFRYYSIERGLKEIASDFNQTLIGSEDGLENYYKFEKNLIDSSGVEGLIPTGLYTFNMDVWTSANGWKGEQLEISLDTLKMLYVQNGTFENGNPGTNEDWINDGTYYADGWRARIDFLSDSGRQRTSYVQEDGRYISLENEGYLREYPDRYQHFNGTEIYWYQVINNTEQKKDFEFKMNYLYQSGPIGNHFQGIFTLKFEILDGTETLWNWTLDLTNVTQRQTWYDTGYLPVNLSYTPSLFEARISLNVDYSSSYVEILDTDSDLDGDSTNGMFITVLIDDVSLDGIESPSYEAVNLAAGTLETEHVNIQSDSGIGFALLNYSSWSKSTIPIEFSANSTVSFAYSIRVSKMLKMEKSSYTTSLKNIGVSYSVKIDDDVNLTLYTYIQSHPEAENLGFIVYHPYDWINASVFNTFGDDVTQQAYADVNFITLPMGAVDSVGWWQVDFICPNYIESITTQTYKHSSQNWDDTEIFMSDQRIRCNVTVLSNSPFTELQLHWFDPDNNLWLTDERNDDKSTSIISEGATIGPYNASIGLWSIHALWINGSEVAYGSGMFEVHHELYCFPQTPEIQVEHGNSYTIAVYLYDQDTAIPVLSDELDVRANWSGTVITLSPNLAKNWWEVDLNTSSIEVGIHELNVEVNAPYFEDTNCTIIVHVTALTIMTIIGNQYVELSPGNNCTIKVRYMFLDGDGIANANISILTWSGPQEGLSFSEATPVFGEIGNYTLEFTASIIGTYIITLTGTGEGLTTSAASFYLIVGPISTQLNNIGRGLPEIMYYNQTYSFSVFYHHNGNGIEGANINTTQSPSTLIQTDEFGDGIYNVSVRVTSTGSYTVYLRISKYGYEYADTSVRFDIGEISTSIKTYGMLDSYFEGREYEFALYYNSSINGGIVDAEFGYPLLYLEFILESESGNGWYNFTLQPIKGNWNITIWLFREGYQRQSLNFIMTVLKIPISQNSAYLLNQTYSRIAGSILSLAVAPIEADTQQPITEALVEYYLLDTTGDIDNILTHDFFNETNGIYSIEITVPEAGLYLLLIRITKENYEDFELGIVLNSQANPDIFIIATFLSGVIGATALLIVVSIFTIGRRYFVGVSARNNIELLSLRTRLEDAKNLMGVQVIHREMGLPIYSKIIRGGFEEAILSSFISAISHFRSEFSMDEPIGTVIPISEVITAVQTNHLICAMINVESPSDRQKGILKEFAKEISEHYDEQKEVLELSSFNADISDEFASELDPKFNQLFDRALMRKYVGVKRNMPQELKPVAESIASLHVDYGVTAEDIIKDLIRHGYSERKAYLVVLDAIDSKYLIQGPDALPRPSEYQEDTFR